jgi:hypothetical protein
VRQYASLFNLGQALIVPVLRLWTFHPLSVRADVAVEGNLLSATDREGKP